MPERTLQDYWGNFEYHNDNARRFNDHLLAPLGIEAEYIHKKPAVRVLSAGNIEVLTIGLNSVRQTHSATSGDSSTCTTVRSIRGSPIPS